MLNTSDFTQRLQQVMDYYGMNATAFADALEIQRSGISHLLSERNKPSLDFILKLIEKFPEVDMYWITQGKGSFPKKDEKTPKARVQPDLFSEVPEIDITPAVAPQKTVDTTATAADMAVLTATTIAETAKTAERTVTGDTERKIRRIIFFYEDNHFEVFDNYK